MPEPSTRVIHPVHNDKSRQSRAVVTPIYQTSTWVLSDSEQFGPAAQEPREPNFYTRHGNPNQAEVAAVVADLEGAEAGMVFASGMGTICTAILALVDHRDHLVVQASMYGGVSSLVANLLPRLGISHTVVDQTDVSAFESAIRENTRMILVETPSNPLLDVTDIKSVAAVARGAGILTVADNTFATPINSRPIELGADLVWHSGTKYLGGHSDLSAGVLAGSKELLDEVWRTAILTGSVLGPIDAWLLMRGIKTLSLRVKAHNDNGLAIARVLEAHSAVARVYYPGLLVELGARCRSEADGRIWRNSQRGTRRRIRSSQ